MNYSPVIYQNKKLYYIDSPNDLYIYKKPHWIHFKTLDYASESQSKKLNKKRLKYITTKILIKHDIIFYIKIKYPRERGNCTICNESFLCFKIKFKKIHINMCHHCTDISQNILANYKNLIMWLSKVVLPLISVPDVAKTIINLYILLLIKND